MKEMQIKSMFVFWIENLAFVGLHSDTVSRIYRFGECFLKSCLGLVGRIGAAIQPRQVAYYSSNFQKKHSPNRLFD